MALQKLNFTQVSNEFIDTWMNQFEGYVSKVFLAISRKTTGYHKQTDYIAMSQLILLTGLSENTIKKSLKLLMDNDLIKRKEIKVARGYSYSYELSMNYPTGSQCDSVVTDGVTAEPNGVTAGGGTGSRHDPTKDNTTKDNKQKKDIYNRCIDYLNKKTGKAYRVTPKVIALIKAREREGYKAEDFKTVIDNMNIAWGKDEKMFQYLRPETLFGTKFDAYLNWVAKKKEFNAPIKVIRPTIIDDEDIA